MSLRYRSFLTVPVVLFLVYGALPAFAQSETDTLVASKDNTLYEDAAGALSNGAGEHLFAGRTNQASSSIRRALLALDLSGIPSGSTIDSVMLTLNMSMSNSNAGEQKITLHRVLADWGEGTSAGTRGEGSGAASTTGDATWIHRLFDTDAWTTPGGDFEAAASDSQLVDAVGAYTWGSTPAMVADVQAWVDDPGGNFGWLLRGNEETQPTTMRFDSRNNTNEAVRPALTVYYTPNATASEEAVVPGAFRLAQNYPNPFNPATTIAYTLRVPQRITLAVFDVLGRRVATLVDALQGPGPYEVTFDGAGLPSGLYRYRLAGEGFSQSRMMVLLK